MRTSVTLYTMSTTRATSTPATAGTRVRASTLKPGDRIMWAGRIVTITHAETSAGYTHLTNSEGDTAPIKASKTVMRLPAPVLVAA